MHRAKQQPQRLQAIGHDQRKRVTRLRAKRAQQRRDLSASACKLGVGDAAAAFTIDSEDRVRTQRSLALDQVANGVAHTWPYLSKKVPKISRSLGTRSAMAREMRVMFR